MKTLLDADYITRDDKAVVRLFYKDSGKGRYVEEITDFEPYFYMIPEDRDRGGVDALKERLMHEKVVRIEEKEMTDLNKKITALKVIAKHPKYVPELRELNVPGLKEVREADIPFAHRYLINSGLIPMENAEDVGLRIAAVDIETYNAHGEPKAERDPAVVISYADSQGMERVWTFTKDDFDNKLFKKNKEEFVILKNESEIIKALIETVKTRHIDLIVSYNGDNFDFPYLRTRCEKLGIKLALGVDDSEVKLERRGMNLGARVRGRPHVDLFPVCRRVFNLPRYTLEYVYEAIFGEKKEDVDAMKIHKYWESYKENPEDFEMLLSYSLSDAVSTLRIAHTLLPLQYELSRIVRQPVYEASRAGSGQMVEHLLIENAYRTNILVPNKPPDREVRMRERQTYVGAYVVDPVKGIHENIVLFDFRSLYPSVIISYNIDPGTLDCDCCADSDFKKLDIKNHFCKKKKGFIPEILGCLIKRRIEIKGKLKNETNIERKKLLDVKQQAVKLLANSFYGYTGFPRARWYCRECASATTALGRRYIHMAVSEAESFGFRVVYGDTDSIFITQVNEPDKEKIKSNAQKFLKKINSALPEEMELEFEGFYPRGIFVTKKRYALMDEETNLTVKGLETRRRDWANVAKVTQQKVLNTILLDNDPEKAAEIVKGVVDDIREGNVEMDDLVINTRLTRKIGEYVSIGPHVMAAKRAQKMGMDVDEGDIIPYIITRKGGSISDKARVANFVEPGDYDANYYIDNQVIPAVMRVFEALNIGKDELKGLGRQMTLGGF
ncbi:MAG: hypothetical protein A7316_05040 [Candidatus Altiarchaeales archaeon WOR_SM1_86-2]|nr:MAG: hypothetical protein A7316_05040 [Candidatus Altiarchaeales archaeon WOR_SM1_86-2]